MTTKTYTHDSQNITIENCINIKGTSKNKVVKLPKGTWQKKLKKIKDKIKKFHIDKNIQWIMNINNQNIDPLDVETFEEILCKTAPPIHIKIKQIDDTINDDNKQSTEYIQLIIHYKNDTMKYKLTKDNTLWNEQTYNKLCNAIKTFFKINVDLILKNDKNEVDLDDMDDIRDELDSYENDQNFTVLHLNVICDENDDAISNEPEIICNPTDIPVDDDKSDTVSCSNEEKLEYDQEKNYRIQFEPNDIQTVTSQSHIIFLLLPQKCNKMEAELSAISDEHLPMKLVLENSNYHFPYLWYCQIETSSFMKPASTIRFIGDNKKVIIEPRPKFKKREHAYYHIEENTKLFGKLKQKKQEKEAARVILAHLRNGIKNWQTYEYAHKKLESLDDIIVVYTKDFLWKNTKENMMLNDEIKYFLQYLLLFEAGDNLNIEIKELYK
eukprot:523712_1